MNSNFLEVNHKVENNKKVTSSTTKAPEVQSGGGSLFESLLRDIEPEEKPVEKTKKLDKNDLTKKTKEHKLDIKQSSVNIEKNVSSEITRDIAKTLVDMVSKESELNISKDSKSKLNIEVKKSQDKLIQSNSISILNIDKKVKKVDVKLDEQQQEKPKVEVKQKDTLLSDTKIKPIIKEPIKIISKSVELDKVVKEDKKDEPKIEIKSQDKIVLDNKIKSISNITDEQLITKPIKVEKVIKEDTKAEPKVEIKIKDTLAPKIEIKSVKQEVVNIIEKPIEVKKELKVEIKSEIKSSDTTSLDIKSEQNEIISKNHTISTNEVLENNREQYNQISDEKLDKTINEIGTIAKNLIDDILKDVDISDGRNVLESKEINHKTIEKKDPFIANMFLSAQSRSQERISSEQLSNAQKNFEKNQTIEGMKKSSDMLNLNLTDAELELSTKKELPKVKSLDKNDKNIKKTVDQKVFKDKPVALDKMVIEKSIDSKSIKSDIPKQEVIKEQVVQDVVTTKVDKADTTITLTVPSLATETIQTKIIGAQQKVNNFMSDMARNMYLNYKPPVHTFKVNLNPANMGTISVVIKSNKSDNSLSVNMNMSNSATMDMFVDNRSALHSALMKNFTEESNLDLNFNMQDGNSEQQQEHKENKQQRESINSRIATDTKEDIEEQISDNIEYI